MNLRQFIGVPWKEDGRDFSGCNCWGLARLARQVLEGKNDLPSYLGEYSVPLRYRELERMIAAEKDLSWTRVDMGQERQGDFILLIKRKFATHVGYVTKPGWMLHIEQGINSVHVPYPSGEHPLSKIEGIYRYG